MKSIKTLRAEHAPLNSTPKQPARLRPRRPRTQWRGLLLAASLLPQLLASDSRADIYTLPGIPSSLSNALVTAFGTASPPAVTQNTFSHYQVPGSGPVEVKFKLLLKSGIFRLTTGIYRYSPDLGRIDLATTAGKIAYATMALDPTNSVAVFENRSGPLLTNGTVRTVTLNGGDVFGMYLIADGSLGEFQTNQASFALDGNGSVVQNFAGLNHWPLFTQADANFGGSDQAVSFAGIPAGGSQPACVVSWEDLTRTLPWGSDNNFIDAIIGIENATPAVIPSVNAFATEVFDQPRKSTPYYSGAGFAQFFSGGINVTNNPLPYVAPDGSVLRASGHRYLTSSNFFPNRLLATNAVPPSMLDAGRFGADDTDIYLAFLTRLESGTVGADYAGVALTSGTNQQLLVGVPRNALRWGVAHSSVTNLSSVPVDGATHLLVARIRFRPGAESVRFYIDPPLSGEPAEPTIPEFTVANFRFDGIRIGSSGVQYSLDEIRLGPTYASVLGDTSLGIDPVATWDNHVNEGSNVVLRITAQGRGPFQYQWFHGPDLLPDATNATLALVNAQMANAGGYSVRVSNPDDSIVVSNLTVTVLASTAPLPITWKNAGGGSWTATNNWSLGRLPNAADTVLITAPGAYTVDVIRVPELIPSVPAPVAVAGTLVVGGHGAPRLRIWDGSLRVAGSITNLADIEMATVDGSAPATLYVTNGVFANTATGRLRGVGAPSRSASLVVAVAAQLDNAGTIDINLNTSIGKLPTPFLNRGTINIIGSSLNGVRFFNNGICNLTTTEFSSQRLDTYRVEAALVATAGTNGSTGIIRGSGRVSVAGGTFLNSGTLAPGQPLGTLSMFGPWAQNGSGAIEVELGGNGCRHQL